MKVFLAKGLTSEFTQVTADVEENSVIIGERNRTTVEAPRRAIDEGNNRIAILYGGGHMPDLGRRLGEEFDLFHSWVQLITAWSIRNCNLNSNSFPFLKTMAEVLGWPLKPLPHFGIANFFFSPFIGSLVLGTLFPCNRNWISHVASKVLHYIDNAQLM